MVASVHATMVWKSKACIDPLGALRFSRQENNLTISLRSENKKMQDFQLLEMWPKDRRFWCESLREVCRSFE